jgi:hypothetical protein
LLPPTVDDQFWLGIAMMCDVKAPDDVEDTLWNALQKRSKGWKSYENEYGPAVDELPYLIVRLPTYEEQSAAICLPGGLPVQVMTGALVLDMWLCRPKSLQFALWSIGGDGDGGLRDSEVVDLIANLAR